MIVIVSEDLNSGPRGKFRFCATVEGDTNQDRGGFGSSERSALWSLAQQLNIHPGTLAVTVTIERMAVR